MVMIFTVSGFVSITQVRSLELRVCSPSLLVLALYILIFIFLFPGCPTKRTDKDPPPDFPPF
jgi:hypothetical protein